MSNVTNATASLIEAVSWPDISAEVNQVNPNLADIINHIDPPKHFKLYKLSLDFASRIVTQGTLQLPNSAGETVPIADPSISNELQEALGYSPIPLTLLLNKACETFFETTEHVVPLNLMAPGGLIGLHETVSRINTACTFKIPYDISVGARSIFMMPKITDSNSHKRLWYEFHTPAHPPRSLWQHIDSFNAIAQKATAKNRWRCDIVLFPSPWLYQHKYDKAWQLFHNYLFTEAWRQSSYLRYRTNLNIIWQVLTNSKSARHLKARPYVTDTIKHLLAISAGTVPAFRAAGQSEIAAPIALIENAYIDVYGLKEYLPIIMHPCYLDQSSDQAPRYYSLATPTLLESYANTQHSPNIITELRDVKCLLDSIQEQLQQKSTTFEQLVKITQYHYFHMHADQQGGIQSTQMMPKLDPSLMQTVQQYKQRVFPASGPFTRGCISIQTTN